MKNKMSISTVICTSVLGITGSCSSMCLGALDTFYAKETSGAEQQRISILKDRLGTDETKSSTNESSSYNNKAASNNDKEKCPKSKETKKTSSFFRYFKTLALIPKIVKYYTVSSIAGLLFVASTDAITKKFTGVKPIETMFSWLRDGGGSS